MYKRFFFSTFAYLVATSLVLAADGKRLITDVDLYNFHWIASPQMAPAGDKIIYTLVKTTPKHDNYETSLWIISSAGGPPRQITSGPHDTDAHWSPDGKMVAFVRAAEKEGKPQPPQIYLLAMDGGEARPLTDLPKGASQLVWAPDGHSIAFSSNTMQKDFEKKKDEEESDVRVISSAKYRMNGAGY